MKITNDEMRSLQAKLVREKEVGSSVNDSSFDISPIIYETIDWTLDRVKKMFEEEERRGARGYSAGRPAKMIESLRAPEKSLRDILIDGLETLYANAQDKSDDRVKENYKLLRTTLENFPVSNLVR